MKNYNAIYLFFSIVIVFIITVLIYTTVKFNSKLKSISKAEIRGLIIKTKEEHRGFYYLEIQDYITNSRLYMHLPGNWFFKENRIQEQDSVSKLPNSNILIFYKSKEGKFQKCCEYVIRM